MRPFAFSEFFNQKIMTGIDIQPEGVQLIQLRHGKPAPELHKIAVLPLDTAVFANGKMMDWDRLTALLFDWVRELGLVGAVTAAALPTDLVRLLRVEGRVMRESLLRSHLEQALPGLGETVVMDYCPYPSNEPATLVAVTKQDNLDNYAACLHEAGLDVKIIDVELFAIQRAMRSYTEALLWQQRGKFTLIWQDAKQLLQQLQWPATYGEQVVEELSRHLAQHNINQLLFCGSTYYCDLFKKAHSLSCDINYFSPTFNSSGVNMPDYLLAIGLALREVPRW